MSEVLATVPSSVLAVYAHPDDPDVSAGGTLAHWADAGCHVHVCICADGEKGSLDPASDPRQLALLRRAEVAAAGEILGVLQHHWLGFGDGELDDIPLLRSRLVELIRKLRPEAVMSADPTAVFFGGHYVNHYDHRAVGWATLDAVSPAAGNPHYFPEAGPAHQVRMLYLSGTLEPDVWVDISRTIDRKVAALASHASQVGPTGEWLRKVVDQRAAQAGREAGVRRAEGFRKIRLDTA